MDQSRELIYAVHDRVALVTINRPERLNAWTPTLETDLRALMEQAAQDDDVRAVVLTGAGRAFCAGMDMEALKAGARANATGRAASDEEHLQRYAYLLHFHKPLLAAINGPASGVGLCLALFCDVRYVAAGAKLSLPYARRGLAAEHGVAWLLPRLIGPMNAADLLLSGRTFLAEEADRMGLARALPTEGFLQQVLQRAGELANLASPRSIRVMKHQLLEARYQTLGQATAAADREIALCRDTEDFKEGVSHFVERRTPHFTGR